MLGANLNQEPRAEERSDALIREEGWEWRQGRRLSVQPLCPPVLNPPFPSAPALVEANLVLLNCSLPEHGQMLHMGKVPHLKGKRRKVNALSSV